MTYTERYKDAERLVEDFIKVTRLKYKDLGEDKANSYALGFISSLLVSQLADQSSHANETTIKVLQSTVDSRMRELAGLSAT